ncbi:nuclear transport factor 2 family protein [Runella limosa]|uniref:nuclear transport factor 2 family protein n=1 Tax=Runella limosa TaxID=370978 RepID=UPI00041E5AA5|nr:nuclear transport factor 2 family protein [Runella limosa]
MKKALLTLVVLSGLIVPSFAQSNSTAEVETALQEFLGEYSVSAYNFFKNRLTDDFRYSNGSGFSTRESVLKNNEGGKGVQSSVSDLKIFRSGDLAVVSGIHHYGTAQIYFTYTMLKQVVNGSPKWMFAASQHTAQKAQK